MTDVVNLYINSGYEGNATVNIYNITGQKIISKKLYLSSSSTNPINLSTLSSGIYLLNVNFKNSSVFRKLIKE